jgi:hypothetical protein
MEVIYGTVTTAIIGGLFIIAFLLGPRLAVGSLVERSCRPGMADTHMRSVLDTLHVRGRGYAELKAFASGGALVLTGLVMAAIYSLLTHRIGI